MKIAVCVPHHGDVKAGFAQSLAGLAAETARATINGARPAISTYFAGKGTLELKRTHLMLAARDWGCDYLLWIDSDQTFPNDALLRLIAREKPIIGCNIADRESGEPTALDEQGRRIRGTGVQQAGAVGLGFCLVNGAVIDRIRKPWFASTITEDGVMVRGEDVHFCNQARLSGVGVFVDHDLPIGHIAERIIMLEKEGANADSVQPSPGDR